MRPVVASLHGGGHDRCDVPGLHIGAAPESLRHVVLGATGQHEVAAGARVSGEGRAFGDQVVGSPIQLALVVDAGVPAAAAIARRRAEDRAALAWPELVKRIQRRAGDGQRRRACEAPARPRLRLQAGAASPYSRAGAVEVGGAEAREHRLAAQCDRERRIGVFGVSFEQLGRGLGAGPGISRGEVGEETAIRVQAESGDTEAPGGECRRLGKRRRPEHRPRQEKPADARGIAGDRDSVTCHRPSRRARYGLRLGDTVLCHTAEVHPLDARVESQAVALSVEQRYPACEGEQRDDSDGAGHGSGARVRCSR